MPQLRISGPDANEQWLDLAGDDFILGRDPGVSIPLQDRKVSRKHAQIGLYGPGAFVLRDLASTNGTFLNGKRVGEKRELKHWDAIRIGDTLLRLTVIEDSIPLST